MLRGAIEGAAENLQWLEISAATDDNALAMWKSFCLSNLRTRASSISMHQFRSITPSAMGAADFAAGAGRPDISWGWMAACSAIGWAGITDIIQSFTARSEPLFRTFASFERLAMAGPAPATF